MPFSYRSQKLNQREFNVRNDLAPSERDVDSSWHQTIIKLRRSERYRHHYMSLRRSLAQCVTSQLSTSRSYGASCRLLLTSNSRQSTLRPALKQSHQSIRVVCDDAVHTQINHPPHRG